jgi:hypothetical protein
MLVRLIRHFPIEGIAATPVQSAEAKQRLGSRWWLL